MKPLPQADLEHVLQYAEDDFLALRGASFFITGGTGFIGTWLTQSLLHANKRLNLGIQATLLTRHPERCQPAHGLTYLQGDICTYPYPQASFTHFIHGATEASAAMIEQEPARMFDTIVSGTRHTLEHAAQCGKVPLLFLSSGAVYGAQSGPVAESSTCAPDPTLPSSCYGEGKRAAELLCGLFHRTSGVECKISRCFAFAGPLLPLDTHFALGNFVRDRLAGRSIQVGGDGTPRRSYLYAADLAVWLWRILQRGTSMRPYNTGSAEAYSIREIADAVAGGAVAVEQARQPEPGAPVSWYVPDTVRARRQLNLGEHFPLHDSIHRMMEWNA